MPGPPPRRGPTSRYGRPGAPGAKPPAPPPKAPAEGGEGAPPPGPGRRGGPQEPGIDKRLIWGAIAGGVVIVGVILGFHFAGRKDVVEEPEKKTSKKGDAPAGDERFPDANTPDGKEAIRKMFDSGDPVRLRKYMGGITPITAVNIKDILIPYLLRLDAGASFNDAFNCAALLANAKDEGVVQKILDLGMKRKDAHALLAAYGAMGADAVIKRAAGDDANLDTYRLMLAQCKSDDAAEPMRAAAEGSENRKVAGLCGDALYYRQKPVAIRLDRVKEWLGDADPLVQAAGVRQMALQKDVDRDAALTPFTTPESAKEARLAVLEAAAKDKTLSRELIRNLLNIKDYEFFQDVAVGVEQARLFDYIDDLLRISDDGDRDGATRRLAGNKAQSLKFIRGDK